MGTVGANWVLIDITGSSTLVGYLLTVNVLAGFLTTPIIGPLTDRMNRKKLLLLMYSVQIVCFLVLGGYIAINGLTVPSIFMFTVVNGIGWTTYIATSRALMQQILERQHYEKGNAMIEISLQVGMFVAGGCAGLIYEWMGFQTILFGNVVVIVISLLAIRGVPYVEIVNSKEKLSFIQDFQLGVSYLNTNRTLFLFGISAIIPSVTTMIFNVVLPGYVTEMIKGDARLFGFSDMAYGIGGFLAGLVVSIFNKKKKQNLLYILYGAMVLNLVILATLHNSLILLIGCFLLGLGNTSIRIWMNAILMHTIPQQLFGRAMATWTGISLLLQGGLAVIVGPLMDHNEANIGFWMIAVIMCIGFYLLFHTRALSHHPSVSEN